MKEQQKQHPLQKGQSRRRIFRKVLPALAMLVLLSLCLTGCTKIRFSGAIDSDILLMVEDMSCKKAEGVFLLMVEKLSYEKDRDPATLWDRSIGDMTMADYVKETVKQRLIRYTTALVMSDQLGAYPTEEEEKAAADEGIAKWAEVSASFDTSAYDITMEDVNELYHKMAVYEAVYRKVTEAATADITEDSTRVMQADYVVIPNSAGEETAYQLRREVKDGADFAEACQNAGFVLQENQVIRRGEMDPNFESVAFALKDGELSEVVESKDGFYIIRCIDDKLVEESQANYNRILMSAKEEAFQEVYEEFTKNKEFYFDEGYWKKLNIRELK